MSNDCYVRNNRYVHNDCYVRNDRYVCNNHYVCNDHSVRNDRYVCNDCYVSIIFSSLIAGFLRQMVISKVKILEKLNCEPEESGPCKSLGGRSTMYAPVYLYVSTSKNV